MRALILLLFFVPVLLTAKPRAEVTSNTDGTATVRFFNDSGKPLRYTVVGEGWSTSHTGDWTLDHSAFLSTGQFSAADKGRAEQIGHVKLGRDAVEKLTARYERVVIKVLLEWSDDPDSDWQTPESTVINVRIK